MTIGAHNYPSKVKVMIDKLAKRNVIVHIYKVTPVESQRNAKRCERVLFAKTIDSNHYTEVL